MGSNPIGRIDIGRIGEESAAKFLLRNGFFIIERNYRKPWGEVDIIAEKHDIVRFVEVKTLTVNPGSDVSREISDYRPEEQVHARKLQKISKMADFYMSGSRDVRDYQIDVVGVFLDINKRLARCRLYEQVL